MSIAFIKVVLKSLLHRWREVVRVCLSAFLALFFVTSVLAVQENIYQWQMAVNRQRFGDWFVMDNGYKENEIFANHPYLEEPAVAYSAVELYDDEFNELGISAGFMTHDFIKRGHITLSEGHMPEKDNEIVMDWNTMLKLGLELELNQTITLNFYKDDEPFPKDDMLREEYVICGILENYTNIWEKNSWLPSILMTDSKASELNEKHSYVYIYPLKTYVRTDNYRELYDNMCSGTRGYLYNSSVYDYRPWGSEFVYNYLYVLVMFIGIAALIYQMLLYHRGRSETIKRFRRLGAGRGQVTFIKMFENLLIIVVFGILGIVGGVVAARVICGFLENAKGVSFYYVGNELIAKALVSVVIAFIVQEAVIAISGITGKDKKVKKIKVKEETKISKISPRNVKAVIRRRFIKSNGIWLNIGVRLFAVSITCILLICSVNIYTAYSSYVDNNNRPDLTGFKQENFNSTFYIPAVVSIPYKYESGNQYSLPDSGTLLTQYLENNYTRDEYINSVTMVNKINPKEDYVLKTFQLFQMADSVYFKDSNTFLSKGITQDFIDSVESMEGVKNISFSSFETSRRWSWEKMDYKKLGVERLYQFVAPDEGKKKDYGSRYVFATDYVEPSKELYKRLSKYIDAKYIDYDAFADGSQVIVILKEQANGEYDDTLNAGDRINYHYADMPRVGDRDYGSVRGSSKEGLVTYLPYYKECYRLRYKLEYDNWYSKSPFSSYYTEDGSKFFEDNDFSRYITQISVSDMSMLNNEELVDFLKKTYGKNYDYFYNASAQPQVAAVIRYSDEFAQEFSDILVDYGYYTSIASLKLADRLIDSQNEFMAEYYETELPEEAKMSLEYNQMSVTYDLSSMFSSTHNVLQALYNSENMIYMSNNEQKVVYREKCINTILQYGITMLAAVVINVCICAIFLKNRLEQRKNKYKLFYQLGMTKTQIFKMNMLEILRESMWCIITLPIQMIMAAIIIGSTVKKI